MSEQTKCEISHITEEQVNQEELIIEIIIRKTQYLFRETKDTHERGREERRELCLPR